MSAADRAERIAAITRGFADYLRDQTGAEIIDVAAVADDRGPDALMTAFERLDAALGQLIDLATVYGDESPAALEPLALPTAALAGEYLRRGLDAEWHSADADDASAGEELIIVLPGGIALDLLGVARAALLSGAPDLTAVARQAATTR